VATRPARGVASRLPVRPVVRDAAGQRGDEDAARGVLRRQRAGTVGAGGGVHVVITSERLARTPTGPRPGA
jgi:hypothetical protein